MDWINDSFLKPTDLPFQILFKGFMITLLSMYVHAQMTLRTLILLKIVISKLKHTFLKPTDASFLLLYKWFMITGLSVYGHVQMTAHTQYVDYCHGIA